MGRHLSSPTAAVRNLKQTAPLIKGGTGGTNTESAASGLGVISKSRMGVAGGVAKLNNLGKIDVEYLPSSVVFGTTIVGPADIFTSSPAIFTISNFDSNTEYSVSVSSGTVNRTGANITFTPPGFVGNVIMSINGKDYNVYVRSTGPLIPSITSPVNDSIDISNNITITGSAFALSTGSGTHQFTDWEVATDYTFQSIYASSYGDGVNKTSWTNGTLQGNSIYYVRVRYKDSVYGYSGWSSPSKFTTKPDFILNSEEAILLPPNPSTTGKAGNSVKMDSTGTRVIMSGPNATGTLSSQGAVYIYVKANGSWSLEAILYSPEPVAGENFGTCVSITADGSRVIVGSKTRAGTYASQGAAYIFSRSGSSWVFEQKLIASDPAAASEFFGQVVTIGRDGTRCAVSAPEKTETYAKQGAIYIYLRTGTVWALESKKLHSDPAVVNEYFGFSLSFNSDDTRLAVGAKGKNAVYVFSRAASVWTQEQKLVSSDVLAADMFGYRVALSGDGTRLAVSSVYKTGTYAKEGAVYIFVRSGTVWTQEQKLLMPVPVDTGLFGISLYLSNNGDVLYASASGETGEVANVCKVLVFTRVNVAWTYSYRLGDGKPTSQIFGYDISVSNDLSYIAVSAQGYDSSYVTSAGAVYIMT